MGQPVNLADINAMTLDDRLALVQAIWDSIAAEGDRLELTDADKQMLDRRMAELDSHPDKVLTWDEIKAHVRGRK